MRRRSVVLLLACIPLTVMIFKTSFAGGAGASANVDDRRITTEGASAGNWLVNGASFESSHFSPLKQITSDNVSRLGLAWSIDVTDSAMGVVAESLVVDGVIYVSGPQSRVFALDASSGELLWKFDPQVRLDQAINGSYSARVNAGVAVYEGKVYVGTGDCRLVAVDARTGKEAWESPVCEASQTGITGAPHVAKGKVFIGYNGSDDGVRGSVIAFDAATGKEAWRFWTVPGDPSKPYETKALEMAARTWTGNDAWKIGGGDVWTAITYDPVTDYLIFGTAGAGVDYGELSRIKAEGAKLFAGCIVAVKADTGEYVWHYQTSGSAVQTENNHIVMADLVFQGEKHHVAMTAPKNGFFYVLDARTGKLLAAKPLVKTDWAKAIDLSTGRPVETPTSQGGAMQWTVHNWWPMSYNPLTGLVYIPITDVRPGVKADYAHYFGTATKYEGRLVAWDPVAESARWSAEEPIAVNSGVLSTAGNLVFQGEGTGEFDAFAADSGKKLWSMKTGSAIDSVPITYSAKGEQYVLVPVGWGSGSRLFSPASMMATPESKQGPVRLLAFKLGGTAALSGPEPKIPAVPKPPEQTADRKTIQQGEVLYSKFVCDGCHSPGIDGSAAWVLHGAVPDLRYAPPDVHKQWYAIVLGGSHWKQGMPGFANPPKFAFPTEKMTVPQADAIHAYVIAQAWKAYNGERQSSHAPNKENY